jgi:hypothetical protein
MSKRYSLSATSTFHRAIALVITAICALALSSRPVSAVTVFSDQFNAGSTLNAAPTAPTASSTSYEFGVGSASGASSSINPGDLSLALGNTASVLGEIEAQFGASPVTLASIGDFIDLQITWVATSNVFSGISGPSTQVALGLYNSGGSAPQQGQTLFNSTTSPTGGAKSWEGYFGNAFGGSNSKTVARPKQNSATSAQNQELLFNNASGTQAFNSPQGGQLTSGSKASTIAETQGATNTSELRITLTGVNSLAVSNMLFAGAGTGGTLFFSENGTTNTASDFTFDGLAFGWRSSAIAGTGPSNTVIDVQSITVTTNVVPEPSAMLLVGAGLGLMLGLVRRRRS